MKANELVEFEQVKNWMQTYKAKDKMNNVRRLAYYLKWRNITFDELMSSKNEEKYFLKMYNEFAEQGKQKYAITITTIIRSFMRFCGLNVKAKHQLNETWYFIDDQIMKNFLNNYRDKRTTKKIANRAIYDYSLFRQMTLAELVNEQKTEQELMFVLLDFKNYIIEQNNVKEATAWRKISAITKFYRIFKQYRIEFEDSVKPKRIRGVYANKRNEQITKDEMNKLLEVADVRDSMILLGLWESGLNSCDLVTITYGMIKQFLNLENPDNIPDCAIFLHIRRKNNTQFYCVLGKQTLKYASLWLKQRANGLIAEKEKLTNESIVFSTKSVPFTKPNNRTINSLTKRISELADLRKLVPTDFRNTFYTKLLETGMDKDIREMFMGHSLGIAAHYTISNEQHYKEEYLKYYELCFDLTFANERVKTLE
ncbi:MAG: tyrosine-type recombinase/integrase, partial [Candidatus Heimdallarchaeota archaeon]